MVSYSLLVLFRASFAGDLQSVSWFAMAVGGICGSLLGGYALTNLKIETIFLLFTVLPALQLLSCALVDEIPTSNENETFPELLDSNEFEEKSSDNYSDTKKSTTRRRKGKKQSGKGASNYGKSVTQKKQSKSLASQLFQSLKAATYELCRAFKQPIIFR